MSWLYRCTIFRTNAANQFRLRGSDGKGGGKALNYACFVYDDWTFYSLALYQSLVEDH